MDLCSTVSRLRGGTIKNPEQLLIRSRRTMLNPVFLGSRFRGNDDFGVSEQVNRKKGPMKRFLEAVA